MKFQACFTYHLWNREVFFLYSESQWDLMMSFHGGLRVRNDDRIFFFGWTIPSR